ncbi:MAG: hypothetical protein K2P48_04050 [Lachnospiraceae bacterium]|nr:hypothetical protein [Lachnospiraceae bacterium]
MYDKTMSKVKIVQEIADVSLVAVGSRSYYIYRYEESLNGIDDAVVLI